MKKYLTPQSYTFEFHVAKKIRKKYQLNDSFFSLNGNVVFANFYQVRIFVQKINEKRNVSDHLSAEEVNAAGLLDEIYHLAIRKFIKKIFPYSFSNALADLKTKFGGNDLDELMLNFINVFPPQKVYTKEITEKKYINGSTNSISNREIILEELLLLYFANRNPAFQKIKELFDENYLQEKKKFKSAIIQMKKYFKSDDLLIGDNHTDLFDFLSMPFIKHSNSIWDQLEYIKNEWGIFIDQKLITKIQRSKDLYRESIIFKNDFDGGGGRPPTVVPKYKGKLVDAEHFVIGKSEFRYAEDSTKEYDEPEQFTPDVKWMPNLILIAKNIYVWLDQLSKKYQKEIKRLDQIPIEELELLKKRNINGLWLIGIWERSSASKRIKHLMGNIDAEASAYSLYDYQIANDIGGEDAYHVFNENAKKCGIRLASDMVPNHTGIFSKWVIEHPEYYIQADNPPFPNYSFTGEDLSPHSDIEIRLEDQYWEMKDAAVVFERKDLSKGETKYFYHGNDGTNMPWNDTAQLNLMKHEVREAIIQKIFEVAKKFSVIRFDAAMTLAKKHFARLWFPEPGKGGDIPSRADHAKTRKQFDDLFPVEFWREVVDRINNEMPETLLLAEAFWLMEGYFVRTLGMHRVYNSAFMNMMMNEENDKYRELITNTLEFEPEILKRYVNFMSNPDEETAIDQFGSGDKYFGVLILMITLPGLPMFAHGQVEGFKEKYGMEYKRAYYDEQPNQGLVEKHDREIFPIMQRRYIFSEIKHFWIYDFLNKSGNVNENVFVYSNEYNGQKGFVIFNNKNEITSGVVHFSRQKLNGNSTSTNELFNTKIADNLNIKNGDFYYYIFQDVTNGLEYLYNGAELHKNGLYANLKGFEYRVFLKFIEFIDTSKEINKYYNDNIGIGQIDIKNELNKNKLFPIHNLFGNIFENSNLKNFDKLLDNKKFKKKNILLLNDSIFHDYHLLINEIIKYFSIDIDIENLELENIYHKSIIDFIKYNNLIKKEVCKDRTKLELELYNYFDTINKNNWIIILLLKTMIQLKDLYKDDKNLSENILLELMLSIPIKDILIKTNNKNVNVEEQLLLINVLLKIEEIFEKFNKVDNKFLNLKSGKKIFKFLMLNNSKIITEFFGNDLITAYLNVNTYKGKKYFSKEKLKNLLDYFAILAVLKIYGNTSKEKVKSRKKTIKFIKNVYMLNNFINKQAFKSDYLLNKFMKKIKVIT